MNSEKHSVKDERGNAMIYVLICLALLAGLTALMARQNNQTSGQNLGDEQAELLATKVMAYAGTVQNAVDQMTMSGTPIASISFLRPGDAGFDTPPHINKLYHLEGGGLVPPTPSSDIFGTCTGPDAGWYVGNANNFEWTPTSANDVVLSAYCIQGAVCGKINQRISGSAAIPTVSGTIADYFVPGPDHSTHAAFTETLCADCEGIPTYCVSNSTNSIHTAYFIIRGL